MWKINTEKLGFFKNIFPLKNSPKFLLFVLTSHKDKKKVLYTFCKFENVDYDFYFKPTYQYLGKIIFKY